LKRLAFALAAILCAKGAGAVPLAVVAQDTTRLDFAAGDIQSATVTSDMNGRPAIRIELLPEAGERFSAFTRMQVGQQISVMACDVEVTRPMVQTPIESGVMILAGLEATTLKTVISQLTGAEACPMKAP
jgi:preprotein translocase subunit SecD